MIISSTLTQFFAFIIIFFTYYTFHYIKIQIYLYVMGNYIGTIHWDKTDADDQYKQVLDELREKHGLRKAHPNMCSYPSNNKEYYVGNP